MGCYSPPRGSRPSCQLEEDPLRCRGLARMLFKRVLDEVGSVADFEDVGIVCRGLQVRCHQYS